MVNVDRVKHQCEIAFYEQKHEKKNRGIGQYYRSDYIGKEMIKSIFTGTLAYAVLSGLWVMANIEAFLDSITDMSVFQTAMIMILVYVGFIAVYMFCTYILYGMRYIQGKKQMDKYKGHLKALNQMYEREEKLKL